MPKRVVTASAIAVLLPVGAVCIYEGLSEQKTESVPSATYSVSEFTDTAAYASSGTVASLSTDTTASSSNTKNTVKSEYIIKNVPQINQKRDFPTGCESVSAVSLMNYYGIEITVDEFIDSYLPQSGYPYYDENGVMHGESPYEYFIGNPRSNSGYGCYSTVIQKSLEAALPEGFSVKIPDSNTVTLQSLSEDYLSKDHPIIIWATMEMKTAKNGQSWLLPDGTEFTFIIPEHCLILIGYDKEAYYFSDPRAEEAIISYPKQACQDAFDAMGRQAVIIESSY